MSSAMAKRACRMKASKRSEQKLMKDARKEATGAGRGSDCTTLAGLGNGEPE